MKTRKLSAPVTLFAAIEQKQYEFLRTAAFQERRSIADVVREAISEYIEKRDHRQSRPATRAKAAR